MDSETTTIKPILAFHFEELLKSLKRRITSKVSIRNPRKIIISLSIHQSLYYAWFRAVRDSVPAFGRTITINKNKNNKIVEKIIKFKHPGVFKYHIGQTFPTDICIDNYIKKTLPGLSKGTLEISEESPLIFSYNRNRGKLTVSGKFRVVNRYGHQCL